MKIKPISDHVLIEPVEEEEKTETGIFLPQTAKKKEPEQGKVAAVGPGRRTDKGEMIPMEVKKGDKVLFNKYGPTKVEIDKKEYLIARQTDILAIIE